METLLHESLARMTSTLVVDNGAWEIKAGLADGKEPSLVMPNCVPAGV